MKPVISKPVGSPPLSGIIGGAGGTVGIGQGAVPWAKTLAPTSPTTSSCNMPATLENFVIDSNPLI